MMTFSLFYDDPLVEPWWSHPSRSASLRIGLFSCFLFWETFPKRLDWIWIAEITCLMIDDSISPDFPTYSTFDATLGHISISGRFRDFHGVTWSFPLIKYVLGRRFVHYCYDDSSIEHLGSHPARHTHLDTQMPSCPSIREVHLSLMSVTLLWIRMTGITYLLMHDWTSFDFPD